MKFLSEEEESRQDEDVEFLQSSESESGFRRADVAQG